MRLSQRWVKRGRAVALAMLATGATVVSVTADVRRIASLDERVSGADRVVVATARAVSPFWHVNEHGDRLIVSRVGLQVEETLKGAPAATVWMDVEGGTLDGLTLEVSSLPLLEPGERAVFFLKTGAGEVHRPFLRGQGILLLDDQDTVRGTSLRVNEIRARARALGGR